jgi:predicted membrane protein
MDFFFTRTFWGLLVMLIGVSIIVNGVFKINFPVFKVLLALFFLYMGFNILYGTFRGSQANRNSVVFGESKVEPDQMGTFEKYDVVFSEQKIDLRNSTFQSDQSTIKLNCVFGSQKVYLPKGYKLNVKGSSVFGSIQFPDGSNVSFGDNIYKENEQSSLPTIKVDASVVFGEIQILE